MPESPRKSAVAAALVALIRIYQRLGSPALAAAFGSNCGCRFAPTCSHYAAEAVRIHGAFAGSFLALRRIVKCTPLHAGGLDPVPERPGSFRCVRVAS